MARHGRLRWFGYLEREITDDWVSSYKNMEVGKVNGRGEKTWGESEVEHEFA